MDFIYSFLPKEIVYTLGLMLLHILWQALIIAITLGVFLLLMRKLSAQSRYVIAVIALILLPITAIITYIKQFKTITYYKEFSGEVTHALTNISTYQSNIIDAFFQMYTSYLPLIVFLWFIGITFYLLKNLGALIYLERIKTTFIYPVSDYINDAIKRISKKFYLNRKVQAYISKKIVSPMIIGHFKPVLLIPEIATNTLGDKEIEAILHHELAHVKRNDYLINIFQSIIEALFFFHPATWWISSIIKKEREECCDVYAINTEDDKLILAKALTLIQELNLNSSNMALSLINKKMVCSTELKIYLKTNRHYLHLQKEL